MGYTAAAMLPKQARGALRKHITKPSEQVAAPPSTNPSYIDDDGVSRVADELPLRHLVLDVRRGEVDREKDQREAHHVHRI